MKIAMQFTGIAKPNISHWIYIHAGKNTTEGPLSQALNYLLRFDFNRPKYQLAETRPGST